MIATLDFETYYDSAYSLSDIGSEAFIRDPRFELLGAGVALGDGPPVFYRNPADWLPLLEGADAVCAHHANFEGFILHHHFGMHPKRWLDTMALGRLHHDVGSLKGLGALLGLGAKGTALNLTKGRRASQLTESLWTALGEYCCQDVAITRGVWRALGPLTPRDELRVIDTVVRWFAEPIFELDRPLLLEALEAERSKKAELLSEVSSLLKLPVQQGLFDPAPSYEAARGVVASADKFASAMRQLGVEVPTKPGANGAIPAVAKTDAFMARSLVSTDTRVKLMAKARQAITSNLGETRAATLADMALRGPMPIYINYSAAHTHRFSGGDGNNIQNFTRGSLLRDAVCAPPGHVCVVADLSQIEARGVAWLAGQLDLLEVFREADRTKGDFYAMFGSQVFQRKIAKADPERQISKALALGMGYGMGTETFSINLINTKTVFTDADASKFNVDVPRYLAKMKKDREGRTAVSRVVEAMGRPREAMEVHLAVTEYFVQLYRTTYAKIAALWKECDDVIKWMAETDRPIKWRGGLIVNRGTITKPNGLVLRYPAIRRGGRGWEYSGGKLYGGLLTENIVQSISRDVLCDMVLRVQARGYRSRMTVHDELVVVVPEADGKKVLDEVLSIMRVAPKWCETWPMNADGGQNLRWGRAKK